MNKWFSLWSMVFFTMLLGACAHAPQTAPDMQPAKFAGRWYEIATLKPAVADATGTMFDLTLNDGGYKVVRTYTQGSLTGPVKRDTGFLRAVDADGRSKFKLTLGNVQAQDFWVMDVIVDPETAEYIGAVVGNSSRNVLSVLSRSPAPLREEYNKLMLIVGKKGYNPNKLTFTLQEGREGKPLNNW